MPTIRGGNDNLIKTGRAAASFFQQAVAPDQVLPVQFHDVWQHGRAQSPERELAVSVLAQAAFDIEKCRGARHGRGRRIYSEAYNWVASDDRTWPYSFLNLCDTLGLSPAFLRARLLNESLRAWERPVGAAA
jgi:hypothetical protein